MQIDKLNNSLIHGALNRANDKTRKGSENVHADTVKNDQASESQVQSILESAAAIPEVNQDKVAKAKALLASGELVTPENIFSAAKNIVKSGF